MKKISCVLLTLILSTFIMVSCDDAGGEDGGDKQIEMPNGSEQTQQGYADDETTGGFTFTAKSAWTATVSEQTRAVSWLRLLYNGQEKYSGDAGTFTLTIELDINYSGETRTATIVIKSGDDTITITVTQQGTKEDGTTPEQGGDPEQNYGGSGTFTYSLHSGFSFDFDVDGAVFNDNRLQFYDGDNLVDLYAVFYLPEGSPLLEGDYWYAPYGTSAADRFYTQKGIINEYLWYAANQTKSRIDVSIDNNVYTIRFGLYINNIGEGENGEISGIYTGYLPTAKPE